MFNLDETFLLNNSYVVQKDLYLKSFLYSFGVFSFIDLLRGQVAEIELLQLVPGFYLILLFIRRVREKIPPRVKRARTLSASGVVTPPLIKN